MNPLPSWNEEETTPAPYSFDDSLWPLLLVRYQGVSTSWEYKEYLAAWEPYLRRNEPYLTLLDARHARLVSAEQRMLRVKWMEANAQALRNSLGSVFVVASPLIRLSLNIVFYFRPMQGPHLVVAHPHEGVGWAAQRLEEAGFAKEAERVRLHFNLRLLPRVHSG